MSEKPILFNGAMVRAIMDGRKTCTRRPIVPQPKLVDGYWIHRSKAKHRAWTKVLNDGGGSILLANIAPYQPGDVLWVRETWCPKVDPVSGCVEYHEDGNTYDVHYKADGIGVEAVDDDGFTKYKQDGRAASPWKPSIHMPRWAARLFLRVTDVRAELLQDITEGDAIAEGVEPWPINPVGTHKDGFALLWDSIYPGCPWDSNCWVWRYGLERVTV